MIDDAGLKPGLFVDRDKGQLDSTTKDGLPAGFPRSHHVSSRNASSPVGGNFRGGNARMHQGCRCALPLQLGSPCAPDALQLVIRGLHSTEEGK